MAIEKVVSIARSHEEVRRMDIEEQTSMTPEQRRAIAAELKRRFWGTSVPDVREYHRKKDAETR